MLIACKLIAAHATAFQIVQRFCEDHRMSHVITKLEDSLEAAFLHWRAGDDEHLRSLVRRELEAAGRGERSIFVALQNGEFIGTGQFIGTVQLIHNHEDPELANGTTRGYVGALEVSGAHRRQGIATALMQRLEDGARTQGFSSLALMVEPDNHAAINLYKHLGYEVFKTSSWRWKEREYATPCMEKTF
jgi:ribosomal protein S18 acetylase RimI-like enzyme